MSLPPRFRQRFRRAAAAAALLALCGGMPAWGALQSAGTASTGAITLPPAQPEGQERVIGYYPSYARAEGYLPADLPGERLTGIHYAFAGIGPDGRVTLTRPEVDLPSLGGLRELRERYPELRLLLSVGGWEESGGFSDAAATQSARRRFARSAADLAAEQGLDGIDLDWEFPVSGGREGTPHRPSDGENYSLLLQAVREALDAQGEADGKSYLLSAAIPPGKNFLENVRPAAMAEAVDYLFFMGYDLHGPWDALAGFNAPLESPGGASPRYTASVREGVDSWLAAGVPPEKLVLGMPLYGYRYQLAPGESGPDSRFTAARSASYDQIAAQDLPRLSRRFHPDAQAPYLVGDGWFISYDDPSSIAAKAGFARDAGLGGIGFWELSQDQQARLIAAGISAWEKGGKTS